MANVERKLKEMEAVVPRPRQPSLVPNQGGMAPPVPGKPRTVTPGAVGGRPAGETPGTVSATSPPAGQRLAAAMAGPVPGMQRVIPGPDVTIERARAAAEQAAGAGAGESPVPGMDRREYDRKMANSPGFRAKYGPGGEAEQEKARAAAAMEGAMSVRQPLAGGGSIAQIGPGQTMTTVPGRRPTIESTTPMSSTDIDQQIKQNKVGRVVTPSGIVEADEQTGRKKWQPSPQAMKVIEQHRDKVMARMNYPGKDDPNAPKPPILPGIPFYNPFTGTFEEGEMGGEAETSLLQQSNTR